MVGAPLASAVAADLAVLRIESKFLVAVLATALLLTCFARTRGLLRVKTGRCEFFVAETATPLLAHSFRVRVLNRSWEPFQAEFAGRHRLDEKLSTGKEQTANRPTGCGRWVTRLNGLAG